MVDDNHAATTSVEILRQAVVEHPQSFETHFRLGNALRDGGDFDGAAAAFSAARDLQPASAAVWSSLGTAYALGGRMDAAITAHQRAVALEPHAAALHFNLANTLRRAGRMAEAEGEFRESIRLDPQLVAAYNNLGTLLLDGGDVAGSRRQFAEALRWDPAHANAASNALLAMHYDPGLTVDDIAEAHAAWGGRVAQAVPSVGDFTGHDRATERCLRVGYVSPDFREHSVARFLTPVLANHDSRRVVTVCYSHVARPDATTDRLRSLVTAWRDIARLSDDDAAELIRHDRVDILVDLAGHTAGNRLGIFARKPAPVQVSYLGYVHRTGLPTIDCRLTDHWADPWFGGVRAEDEVFRLPWGFHCYEPPCDAPPVGPLACGTVAAVTFGSFNHLAKINRNVIDTWSELLKQVAGARLILKALSLEDAEIGRRIERMFAERGIGGDRVELRGRVASAVGHLRMYHDIDIALDPFPYAGTTTTCEALWMGVPVVTLAGDSHASRVGVSLLSQVGLNELVARDAGEYVQLAAELAADRPRLARLRRGLRVAVEQSSLCDSVGFTRQLEDAYRALWRRFCADQRPLAAKAG